MSGSVKGTQTEKNLLVAFAGESQARNRYSYYSGAAKKEGLVQISAIFEETANQEKEHAKRFFKLLEGGEVQIVVANRFMVSINGRKVSKKDLTDYAKAIDYKKMAQLP